MIAFSARKNWITNEFQGLAAIALAVVAFASAEMFHGNGFIAAFIAGLTYGNLKIAHSSFMHEFTETESQFLALITFFLFGALILPGAIENVTTAIILYALLSLTVVRMVPVTIAMMASGQDKASILFLGWFGPRGLASILFALLILEDLNVSQIDFVQSIVAITVGLSIILHGITAGPFSKKFGLSKGP